MAHIEEFTIHGLAGHERPVSRTLDRNINIFWGLNGTGKTSLLKILNAALHNEIAQLSRLPFERAEVVFWSSSAQARIIRSYTKETHDEIEPEPDDYEYELEEIGDGLWRQKDSAHTPRWETKVLSGSLRNQQTRFRHTYLPISRMINPPNRFSPQARRGKLDEATLDQQFAEQVRRKWQTYTSDALLAIRQIQQQGLASILAHLFGGGSGTAPVDSDKVSGVEAHSIVQHFLAEQGIHLRVGQDEFLQRYEQEVNLQKVVANIQEVKLEVEEALRPQHEFQEIIQALYSGKKQLLLDSNRRTSGIKVAIDGETIPLESLSSGEKQLLHLMLETLAADTDTVMIDEPEISMHVDWQQVLVESMRKINPNCQLLLATHSPEVMADVAEKFVFQL